ncbi:MAG TPA: hypothetical protein P5304_16840 [Phycisphaerae bacterium]|nr:hypothetical protein [Phycisphaerae bacterium]
MNMSDRDRRALVLGGVAVGMIAVYLVALNPLVSRYNDMLADHEQAAAKVARILGEERKAADQARQIAEWERKAGQLSEPKPYSEQITSVSYKLVAAYQASGMQVKNSNWTHPIPWPDDRTLSLATIRIDAEADWENVFKFVAAVYRIEGVMSIDRLELAGDSKKPGPLTVKLAVSVLVRSEGDNRWAS